MTLTNGVDVESSWLSEDDCDVNELRTLVATSTELMDYPHAVEVRGNVPVYDSVQLRRATSAVAAVAEGYPFPTNLDRDTPVGGGTPQIQAELTWEALQGDWTTGQFEEALRAHSVRRRTQ